MRVLRMPRALSEGYRDPWMCFCVQKTMRVDTRLYLQLGNSSARIKICVCVRTRAWAVEKWWSERTCFGSIQMRE